MTRLGFLRMMWTLIAERAERQLRLHEAREARLSRRAGSAQADDSAAG